MKTAMVTLVAGAILLSGGCHSQNTDVFKKQGWHDVHIPRSDLLGKHILDNDAFGLRHFNPKPNISKGPDSIVVALRQRINAHLSAKISDAGLDIKYEDFSLNKVDLTGGVIIKEINDEDVFRFPPKQTFVYGCLSAGNVTIDISGKEEYKTDIKNVLSDALNDFFNVKDINIPSINFTRGDGNEPSTALIKVKSPDVCIMYKKAKWIDKSRLWNLKYLGRDYKASMRHPTSNGIMNYELGYDEETKRVECRFSGLEPRLKYKYYITVGGERSKPELYFCVDGKDHLWTIDSKVPSHCIKLEPNKPEGAAVYTRWDYTKELDIVPYGEFMKIVKLHLNAKITEHGSILIKHAYITYPEQKLKVF